MKKIEVVEIQRHDLILRVVAFDLYCDDPFDGLLQQSLKCVGSFSGIQLFGQLLRDGRTTSRIVLAHDATLHHGTPQRFGVDAAMVVETFVFCGHQRLEEMGRYAIGSHKNAVFAGRPSAQQFTIGSQCLRCEFIDGILDALEIRHVADPSTFDCDDEKCSREDKTKQQ